MREGHGDLEDALRFVDPSSLGYDEWLGVGMALHESGLPCRVWDDWSRRDPGRYHEGECERKWAGFGDGAGDHLGSGSIVRMAEAAGWSPSGPDEALDWDQEVEAVTPEWADEAPMPPDEGEWHPARELGDYLRAVFEPEDVVGYVTESWQPEEGGRWVPAGRGHWDRTAGQLERELASCCDDVGKVVGDWQEGAGAWIRFNPLDGRGVRNSDVAEYRYALVESDVLEPSRQLGMVEAMRLPCAAVVSSGGKSVHAVVRIDAGTDYALYRKRVERLYAYCKAHGFAPDVQNKNPSRLSRMPGVTRNGRRQRLLATSCGCSSWDEWEAWVEESEDDLPETVGLYDKLVSPDPISPAVIGTEAHGLLRRGHKMLVAGPSKAGKSMLLMELAECIASGTDFIGYPCARGRVLYVNLEIDAASAEKRFAEIARARGLADDLSWARNVDLWNLRGHAVPMDQLVPRLVRRARQGAGDVSVVIIDPIYKVITGDENSAGDMARFCNEFDKVAARVGCSVVYCHHHSKGAQGQKKAIDRSSGSGVFARDPDAVLDLAPLDVPPDMGDDLRGATAWRVSATLREFPSPEPIDLYFRYPLHVLAGDETRRLKVEGEDPFAREREAKRAARRRDEEQRSAILVDAYRRAVADGASDSDGMVPATEIEARLGTYERTGRVPTIRSAKEWAKADWCDVGCEVREVGTARGKTVSRALFYDKRERDLEDFDGGAEAVGKRLPH